MPNLAIKNSNQTKISWKLQNIWTFIVHVVGLMINVDNGSWGTHLHTYLRMQGRTFGACWDKLDTDKRSSILLA